MVREAKSRLAIKIDREGWKGGIDHIWVDLFGGCTKRQCGGLPDTRSLDGLSTKMMTFGWAWGAPGDLTGAHYELIRAMTGSVTLPPTRLLRGRLRETWAGEQVADPQLSLDEVKMLPIRVINSGAARALKHVTDKGLGIPPVDRTLCFWPRGSSWRFHCPCTKRGETKGWSSCQKSSLLCRRSHWGHFHATLSAGG